MKTFERLINAGRLGGVAGVIAALTTLAAGYKPSSAPFIGSLLAAAIGPSFHLLIHTVELQIKRSGLDRFLVPPATGGGALGATEREIEKIPGVASLAEGLRAAIEGDTTQLHAQMSQTQPTTATPVAEPPPAQTPPPAQGEPPHA